jgi:hypothetical protein
LYIIKDVNEPGSPQSHLTLVHRQRNKQLTRKHEWSIIFRLANEVTQVMAALRESRCLTDIIVEGITGDFVDVEDEGVQKGTIVDGDGNRRRY